MREKKNIEENWFWEYSCEISWIECDSSVILIFMDIFVVNGKAIFDGLEIGLSLERDILRLFYQEQVYRWEYHDK